MKDETINEALERINKLIDEDEQNHEAQVNHGDAFGRRLDEHLRSKGFKPVEQFDRSTVSTYEVVLARENTRVRITSAVFLGAFTDVRIRRGREGKKQ